MDELLEYQILLLLFGANAALYICAVCAFVYFGYRRLRIKGYPPPAAVAIFLTAVALGIALTVLRQVPMRTTHSVFWFELFWVNDFWAPLLLSALVMGILLAILPRLRIRVFGQRRVRFPLVWVGRALIALGLALSATGIVLWSRGLERGWHLAVFGLLLTLIATPTALFVIGLGEKAKSVPALEEVLANDSRSPVLYLRAFLRESQCFVIGPKSEYAANAKSWHAMQATWEQNIGIKFEEYLGDALSRSIGPFIALGNPEDYLPPEGALRTYADDSHWKDLFHRFAEQSACMVVEVGKSSNLHWEFMEIRQKGLQTKLFVFTAFSRSGFRLQWAFWNLLWLLKGIRPARWHDFSGDLRNLGYDMGLEDPGPGSVITFDHEGRAMVLTTGARRPEDFVGPIAAWITSREKTGRHFRMSCSQCGRPIYSSAMPSETTGKFWCQACEISSLPGFRVRKTLRRVAGYVCWAYLLLPYLVGYILVRGFSPEAGWGGRVLGGMVISLLPLAFGVYNWAKRTAWDGSPKDDRRAAGWYREAAAAGSTSAMVNLGLMYRRGWGGLSADDVEAARWYLKAAERGHPGGMNNLGYLYEKGLGGLPKDQAKAITWYEKAASLGQTQSQQSLKRLERGVSEAGSPKTK